MVPKAVDCGIPYPNDHSGVGQRQNRSPAIVPLGKKANQVRRPVSGGSIGERIAARLEELGISKAELIRRMGKDFRDATLHEWIREEYEPTAGYLGRLATGLEMTLEELIGVAEGQRPPFAAWDGFLATDEGKSCSPDELRSLASVYWGRGREPTVYGYQQQLAALRVGTKPRTKSEPP